MAKSKSKIYQRTSTKTVYKKKRLKTPALISIKHKRAYVFPKKSRTCFVKGKKNAYLSAIKQFNHYRKDKKANHLSVAVDAGRHRSRRIRRNYKYRKVLASKSRKKAYKWRKRFWTTRKRILSREIATVNGQTALKQI